MKKFKCYSAKLANILIHRGFKLIGKEINYAHPQYYVYLFEDSEELQKVFDEYCINGNK